MKKTFTQKMIKFTKKNNKVYLKNNQASPKNDKIDLKNYQACLKNKHQPFLFALTSLYKPSMSAALPKALSVIFCDFPSFFNCCFET